MIIDLKEDNLYIQDEIDFDKKVSFVFGRNGTGKTKLAKLIKEQNTDRDVRLFSGFDGVLGNDGTLNAIILGETNNEIETEIEKIEDSILIKKNEIKRIINNITETKDATGKIDDNLWKQRNDNIKLYESKERELNSLLRNKASIIKNMNPPISVPAYNITHYKADIAESKRLSTEEISICEQVLKSEVKVVKFNEIALVDLEKYLISTNSVLATKVNEVLVIERLENNDKRNFAKDGLEIHKKGDTCAFCGNDIDDSVFDELTTYFSASEVEKLKQRIDSGITSIQKELSKMRSFEVEVESFYPEYRQVVSHLKLSVDKTKQEYEKYLLALEKSLEEKKKNLFSSEKHLDIDVPSGLQDLQSEYIVLSNKNNMSNLPKEQEKAKENLRYHYIDIDLEEIDYYRKSKELEVINVQSKRLNLEIERERIKIDGNDGLNQQLISLKDQVTNLQLQTKNEHLLATRINKTLRESVSFELEHIKSGSQGHYMVKCDRTKDYRDITQLSTGEKNIIAFLYFIEKLNEIGTGGDDSKIIIFDDPMSSNDASLQYIIMDKLWHLMKDTNKKSKIILLTHNIHFYINIKYKKRYKENCFYRLVPLNKQTEIMKIEKEEEDFSTSYESLWHDLIMIYNSETVGVHALITTIRRINETFANFNGIVLTDFYSNVTGAKKFLDVGAHSIDDFDADLIGKEKHDVINIMKRCYLENNSGDHFNKYWTVADEKIL